MILVSVLAFGLVVALSLKLSVSAAATIVGVFAVFHGYAHGGELGTATAMSFGTGFALATAALHAVGLAVAIAASRSMSGSNLVQGLGLATAFGGAWIAIG